MRPEFVVVVAGGDERALEALTQARLKVAGSMINEQTGDEAKLEVVVDADSADAARARVEKNLPPDGNYVIERVSRRQSD